MIRSLDFGAEALGRLELHHVKTWKNHLLRARCREVYSSAYLEIKIDRYIYSIYICILCTYLISLRRINKHMYHHVYQHLYHHVCAVYVYVHVYCIWTCGCMCACVYAYIYDQYDCTCSCAYSLWCGGICTHTYICIYIHIYTVK